MNRRIERWTLAEIAELVEGTPGVSASSIRARAVSTDTRTLADGALFVALVGERFDGHDYVEVAAEQGACGAIVSRPVGSAICEIVVDDTLSALQLLGAAIFAELEAGVRTIALTGSNGKTTTKELIAALWSGRARVHATAGNLNNHIGVPLTLCDAPEALDVLVLEMGSNGFGDIEELVRIAPTNTRVITSIGHAHLEGFGSLDGVRRAKSEIFDHADRESLAIVPVAERDRLDLDGFDGEILTVGRHDSGATVQYEQTGPGRVLLRAPDIEYDLRFSLPGTHNAQNLATAFATVVGAGQVLSASEVQRALDDLRLPGGRWRQIRRGGWRILDDAYNANPSSVRASWDAFAEIVEADDAVVGSDVVAVIGEMFELGAEAESLHVTTAESIAARGGATAYAFVGAFAEAMAVAARDQTDADVEAFDTPSDVADWLSTRAPGLLYLKASRGQKLERIIDELPD